MECRHRRDGRALVLPGRQSRRAHDLPSRLAGGIRGLAAQLRARPAGSAGFISRVTLLPFCSWSAQRITFDARWIVAGSSLLGAGASFAFAGLADGFWPALAVRFLGGIALAGVHMPGLVLLTNALEDRSSPAAYRSIPRAMRSAAQARSSSPGSSMRCSDGGPRFLPPGSVRSSPLPPSAAFLRRRRDRPLPGLSWNSAACSRIGPSWPTCSPLPATPGKCSVSASGSSPAFRGRSRLPGNELDLPNSR